MTKAELRQKMFVAGAEVAAKRRAKIQRNIMAHKKRTPVKLDEKDVGYIVHLGTDIGWHAFNTERNTDCGPFKSERAAEYWVLEESRRTTEYNKFAAMTS